MQRALGLVERGDIYGELGAITTGEISLTVLDNGKISLVIEPRMGVEKRLQGLKSQYGCYGFNQPGQKP